MKRNISWFSLVEILVWILIVAIIMIAWFQALASIWIWKIKLIERTRIEKQSYFAAEKFFELLKKWGTIDYEEYWNRYSNDTSYSSGYFLEPSGFWNFWHTWLVGTTTYGPILYFCRSKVAESMWTNGCLDDFNTNGTNTDISRVWPQNYWQYSYQFIDYNSDADNDGGDEDGEGLFYDFMWDDDDLYLGIGPDAFPEWIDVWELYLINSDKDERTYFRWNVQVDPNALPGSPCNGTKIMTGTWCLGTIQFLKLVGSDEWYDHASDGWVFQDDGVIDTWRIHPDFDPNYNPPALTPVAGSDTNMYWQDIFPDTIHVSQAEFYLYPNKDTTYSWRDTSDTLKVAPYLELKLTLQPSWKQKKKIRWEVPSVEIATTIQLLDFDLR